MNDTLRNVLRPRSGDDGAERGHRALVVTAVLTALSIVFVGLRMYTRAGLMKLTGREDYMILVSLALVICYLGLVSGEVHYSLGQHGDTISRHEYLMQMKSLWVAIPLYNASLCCTKFSMLFQYLRIFPERRFRIACFVVMGIVGLYSTWAVVSGFVNCVPVAKFWDRSIPGTCLNFAAVWFFNASMNIATDLTMLIMPMPLLSQLQLPRMQKLALMGVFAIGILVIITSILRLRSLKVLVESPDPSWDNVEAAYWTGAECNVAIICACLPFLKPLVARLFPRIAGTTSYNRYNTKSKTYATNRSRPVMELHSQDPEYGMYDIDVKSGHAPSGQMGGIEVTTTMVQESSGRIKASTSQQNLVSNGSSA